MDKRVYDSSNRELGKVRESGSYIQLYDHTGRDVGKIKASGVRTVLYDHTGREKARFDGRNTYDYMGRLLGSGDKLLSVMFPTMAKIK